MSTKTKTPLTVREIIDRGGGPAAVADSLKIPKRTVWSWINQDALPEKHWAGLRKACRVSLEALHEANEAGRRRDHPKPRAEARSEAAA